MAAYLHTVIDGNKSFGGYLSVDGEKAFAVNDDTTYELSPGHHYFVLYSLFLLCQVKFLYLFYCQYLHTFLLSLSTHFLNSYVILFM